MAKSQLIKLRSNGNILNTAEIIGIVRKELNVYAILMRNCPAILAADGKDVDDIVEYMEIPLLGKEESANEKALVAIQE